jgi:amidohydrolase
MDRVVMSNIQSALAAALPHTISLRQRLHTIPELSYEEHKTADMIRLELRRLNIPFTAGVPGAPTSTIGLAGDPGKPCIALRADIDALPVQEETGQPYTSTHPGRMHACGHDGHTAALLGTAAILSQLASSLPICVKLIWQPAEETGGGAQRLVEASVLDGRIGPKVQAIFAEIPHAGARYDCGGTGAGRIGTTSSFVSVGGATPVPSVHTSSAKVRRQVFEVSKNTRGAGQMRWC